MTVVYYGREEFERFLDMYVWDTPLKWEYLGYILGELTYVVWKPETSSRVIVRSSIVSKEAYRFNEEYGVDSVTHIKESDYRAKNSIRAWAEKWSPSGHWYSSSKGTRTYRLPKWPENLAKKLDKLLVGVGRVCGASAVPEEVWTWAGQDGAEPPRWFWWD